MTSLSHTLLFTLTICVSIHALICTETLNENNNKSESKQNITKFSWISETDNGNKNQNDKKISDNKGQSGFGKNLMESKKKDENVQKSPQENKFTTESDNKKDDQKKIDQKSEKEKISDEHKVKDSRKELSIDDLIKEMNKKKEQVTAAERIESTPRNSVPQQYQSQYIPKHDQYLDINHAVPFEPPSFSYMPYAPQLPYESFDHHDSMPMHSYSNNMHNYAPSYFTDDYPLPMMPEQYMHETTDKNQHYNQQYTSSDMEKREIPMYADNELYNWLEPTFSEKPCGCADFSNVQHMQYKRHISSLPDLENIFPFDFVKAENGNKKFSLMETLNKLKLDRNLEKLKLKQTNNIPLKAKSRALVVEDTDDDPLPSVFLDDNNSVGFGQKYYKSQGQDDNDSIFH